MFGNPFSRKSIKKNCYQVFCKKYFSKNNLYEIINKSSNKMKEQKYEFQEQSSNKGQLKIISYDGKLNSLNFSSIDKDFSHINENDTIKVLKNNSLKDSTSLINKTDTNQIKFNINELYCDDSETSLNKLNKENDGLNDLLKEYKCKSNRLKIKLKLNSNLCQTNCKKI